MLTFFFFNFIFRYFVKQYLDTDFDLSRIFKSISGLVVAGINVFTTNN